MDSPSTSRQRRLCRPRHFTLSTMASHPADQLPELPCYVNGEITPMRDARISPFDRGFIFGDGVYEGISFYGRPGQALQAYPEPEP